jgi:hypothetical protein
MYRKFVAGSTWPVFQGLALSNLSDKNVSDVHLADKDGLTSGVLWADASGVTLARAGPLVGLQVGQVGVDAPVADDAAV